MGKAICFYITRPTFKRILGPLQSILETDMDKYAKYHDAMKDAAGEEEQEEKEPEDEDTHNAAKQEKKPKVVRKREKKQEDCNGAVKKRDSLTCTGATDREEGGG